MNRAGRHGKVSPRARHALILCGAMLAVLCAGAAHGASAQARAGYEAPPTLRARDLVPAERLQGPGYEVDDAVPTDGFLATFTVRSDHGVFEARGPGMLEIRLGEVAALRQLDAISTSDAFVKGLRIRRPNSADKRSSS